MEEVFWDVVDMVQAFPLALLLVLGSDLGAIFAVAHAMSVLLAGNRKALRGPGGAATGAAVLAAQFLVDLFVLIVTAAAIPDCIQSHQRGASGYAFGLHACHGTDFDLGVTEALVTGLTAASFAVQVKRVGTYASEFPNKSRRAVAVTFVVFAALVFVYLGAVALRSATRAPWMAGASLTTAAIGLLAAVVIGLPRSAESSRRAAAVTYLIMILTLGILGVACANRSGWDGVSPAVTIACTFGACYLALQAMLIEFQIKMIGRPEPSVDDSDDGTISMARTETRGFGMRRRGLNL